MKEIKRFVCYLTLSLMITLTLHYINPFDGINPIRVIKLKYYDNTFSNVEEIHTNGGDIGNSQGNINNYGFVDTNKDEIFYANNGKIRRAKKDDLGVYSTTMYCTDTNGQDTINIVNDWVFFRQGDRIKRYKIDDGTTPETIFKGYSYGLRYYKGNLYFVSIEDGFNLFKIDVNGKNREVIVKENVNAFTIYQDKIYYSAAANNKGIVDNKSKAYRRSYIYSSSLDGSNKKMLGLGKARQMIGKDNQLYYIGENNYLYTFDLKLDIEKLFIAENMESYNMDDQNIYYLARPIDDDNTNKISLYRVDLLGREKEMLDDIKDLVIDNINLTEENIFYENFDDGGSPIVTFRNKYTNEVIEIEEY